MQMRIDLCHVEENTTRINKIIYNIIEYKYNSGMRSLLKTKFVIKESDNVLQLSNSVG